MAFIFIYLNTNALKHCNEYFQKAITSHKFSDILITVTCSVSNKQTGGHQPWLPGYRGVPSKVTEKYRTDGKHRSTSSMDELVNRPATMSRDVGLQLMSQKH